MRFLIDTGAAKNYIRPHHGLKGVRPVDNPFTTHSIHGTTKISEKCYVSMFGKKATFFLLSELSTFDGIIGLDLLTEVGAELSLSSSQLRFGNNSEPILYYKCVDVNFTNVDCADAPPLIRENFLKMLINRKKTFADANEALPYNTAVIIIRSKIRGSADAVLSSFATILNFDAIINRLDFTYSDKRPVHVIEQEMGTLRQGQLTLPQYYDEVEKKLTLLINKVNMTYDAALAKGMCEKFRGDALRIFISGLKRSLSDVLFAAHPLDLPTALALAQEIEANHERYTFAANYARSIEDKARRPEQKPQFQQRQKGAEAAEALPAPAKSPHYTRQQKPQQQQQPKQFDQRSGRQSSGNNDPQPMDVDPSMSRVLMPSQAPAYANSANPQAFKRTNTSDRATGQRRQRVNHTTQSQECGAEGYAAAARNAEAQIADDSDGDSDALNFLGVSPCCPSSGGK